MEPRPIQCINIPCVCNVSTHTQRLQSLLHRDPEIYCHEADRHYAGFTFRRQSRHNATPVCFYIASRQSRIRGMTCKTTVSVSSVGELQCPIPHSVFDCFIQKARQNTPQHSRFVRLSEVTYMLF